MLEFDTPHPRNVERPLTAPIGRGHNITGEPFAIGTILLLLFLDALHMDNSQSLGGLMPESHIHHKKQIKQPY